MRALIQRTTFARVRVDGLVVGEIGPGMLIFLCAMRGDGPADAERLARKTVDLRIFHDAAGRMNHSLRDTGGAALVVSQFTLAAETRGNRPGLSAAASPEDGRRLVDLFAELVRARGVEVALGVFGAKMNVELVNDGPVTIWLDTERR